MWLKRTTVFWCDFYKKIEVIQNQALRICCGAFRSSPVASLQVEMGELPLEQRRFQLWLRYWSGVKGHLENHPVTLHLKDCWEYEYKEITKLWLGSKEGGKQVGVERPWNCSFCYYSSNSSLVVPYAANRLSNSQNNKKNGDEHANWISSSTIYNARVLFCVTGIYRWV